MFPHLLKPAVATKHMMRWSMASKIGRQVRCLATIESTTRQMPSSPPQSKAASHDRATFTIRVFLTPSILIEHMLAALMW